MENERFGDDTWGEDVEEAFRIVTELADLNEATLPREIASLVQRARSWRRRHTSVVE